MTTRFIELMLIGAVALLYAAGIQAQSNVVISFITTNSTSLNEGFAGFTTELLGTGVE